MSMTEKFSGLDFLNAVEAKEGDGKNRKAAIFNALFKACGTEFSDKDFPERSANDEISKLRIKLEAPKRAIFIYGYERKKQQLKANGQYNEVGQHLIKPENRDYMLVAMGAYLDSGGKVGDFRKDLDIYKNKYRFEQKMKEGIKLDLSSSRDIA